VTVVWVTTELSGRPRSGGTLRSLRLLAAVAERLPVDVVVVGPGEASYDTEVPARSVRRFAGRSGLAARATALLRGWPTTVSRAWDPAAASCVARLGGVVVVDFVQAAAYRPASGPYVLSLHNLERDVVAPLAGRSPRAVESRLDAVRRERWERALLADPRARVVTVSARDAAAVPHGALVVPNGADLAASPAPPPAGGPLVYVGACDYPPNAEAVAWWAEAVWPLLRTPRPLHVAGRAPEALGALAEHPGVRVVGEVEDTAPVLAAASLVVVPLRSGGGTRIKVLEALAHGRPVVSTPKGVEGLPLGETDGVLVGSTAAELAGLVDALGADPARCAALGVKARAAAEAYDWRRVAAPFADLVESLAQPR
jgi:glycosyltransferase involved in cell wall biosynthesis